MGEKKKQNDEWVFFQIGCAIQYDPKEGAYPQNPTNSCGPNNPMCDRYWK